MGGGTAVERCCWMYGVRNTGWGGGSAIGVLASAVAALPVVAHEATREHSDGGQCEQSCSDPTVQEGVADGSASWWARVEDPEATEAWLSRWGVRIGEAQATLVPPDRSATSISRASGPKRGTAMRYLISAP